MAIVNLEKLMTSSKRAELFETLFAVEGKVLSFGDLLDTLQDKPATAIYVDVFRSLSVQDILDHAASLVVTTGKAPRATVEVPAIENFKDETVQAAWIAKATAHLGTVGVGESGRGISPQDIRVAMGSGNESQGRELMTRMEAAGTIYATSKARGKKYVLAQHKAAADAAWAKEQAEAKVAEEAKAKAAAEKAKTAPAVDAKADTKAAAKPKAPKA
jgi:hypothetical protein